MAFSKFFSDSLALYFPAASVLQHFVFVRCIMGGEVVLPLKNYLLANVERRI